MNRRGNSENVSNRATAMIWPAGTPLGWGGFVPRKRLQRLCRHRPPMIDRFARAVVTRTG